MKSPAPASAFPVRLAAAALIALFAAQALWHAAAKSATFDEPAHLAISYLLHATDHRDYDISHPPLARYWFGIPLSLMSLSLPSEFPAPAVERAVPLADRPDPKLYYFSTHFLYRNRAPADRMLFSARMMNVILGCLLGACIFLWTRRLYGEMPALVSLAFFAFCPNLIAHSSLVTTDLAGCAAAVAFLYALHSLLEKDRPARRIAAGAALGAALLTKYTNVFLVPLFLLVIAVASRRNRSGWKAAFQTVAWVGGASWFTVCLGYGFGDVLFPHALAPADWEHLRLGPAFQALYRWLPLPDSFLHGAMSVLQHSNRGHAAFLLGEHSVTGWRHYFLIAFLVKTPTATLLLLLLLAVILAARKARPRFEELLLLLPLAFLAWTAFIAQLNIGLRHVLLAYPILYVAAGKVWTAIDVKDRRGKILAGALAAALIAEVSLSAPHALAFFNRPSGGPGNGINLLSDSNLDWGQDLKGLAKLWEKQGRPELVLSYFGTAVPQSYGITYQSLPAGWSYPGSNHVNSARPAREWLAVSATNLQGTYFSAHDIYAWLLSKEPLARVGYSIYVYDITNDRESHERLLRIYEAAGRADLAARQRERLKAL